MTEIKICSLYGQFILEQRIIAATIIINKPGTGLKKYEMVNRTIYIYLKLSLSLCQFFSNVLVSFLTLAKHHLIAIISFLGLINQSTELQGGELDATYPSTSSCLPTPGNLLDIYKSCSLETFGIHLDTYNSNFLDY